MNELGAPPDAAAWCALGLAVAAFAFALRPGVGAALLARSRLVIALLAVTAGALSCAYVAHYLRGGPRIIDATSYLLEARTFATGHLSFPIPSPTGSFRGRFLLPSPDGHALSVIFPPGYPALLAVFVRVGAPLALGPLLAVLLVLLTADVARRLFDDERAALLAAALSATCAVLRYHTADTMSHGLAAALLTGVVAALLAGRAGTFALAGLLAGALVATRPVSGGVAALLVLGAAWARRSPVGLLLALGAFAVPVSLFVFQQRAATGLGASTQYAYYALSDAPPGCFRYGFGAGVGCRFEHGDFVAANLASGYGPTAALLTTLRRLKMHLADAANVELGGPLVVWALVRCRRARPTARLAPLTVAGLVLAYAPFYFDGNYPGGGARFFADALPIEHAALAWLLLDLRLARFALPMSLAGFALHTSYDHVALANREGGAPMYSPERVAGAGVSRGLVFVDTDHGFDLGHAPGALDASRGVVVARRRGDAHDWALWDALGRPPAYHYAFPLSPSGAEPRLAPVAFEPTLPAWRFEAEGEWPVVALDAVSAYPDFPPCASGARALRLERWGDAATGPREASVTLELRVPRSGEYRVALGWANRGGKDPAVRVAFDGSAPLAVDTHGASSEVSRDTVAGAGGVRCGVSVGRPPWLAGGSHKIMISSIYGYWLDYIELQPSAGVGEGAR